MEISMKTRISLILFFFLSACSTAPIKNSSTTQSPATSNQSNPEQKASSKVMGPPESHVEAQGPKPVSWRPLVLVCGPGMARSFALLGVLQVLEENQIPVSTIVGTEMGAFLAAVAASSRSLNEVEWRLLKFQDDLFDPNIEDGILQRMLSFKTKEDRLAKYLNEQFKNERIDDSRIKLWIGMYDRTNNSSVWFDRGKMKEILRGTLAIPDWFKPYHIEKHDFVSSMFSLPYPVHEAIALRRGPTVLIDFLSDSAHGDEVKNQSARTIENELNSLREANSKIIQSADLVIKPDLKGVGFFSFKERNEAVYAGRKSTEEALEKIKSLILVKE